jgi:sigma-B regulation protein RsbU (phosphoserine phosphatase)
MPYEEIQSMLRADAAAIAMAVILVSAGVASILLFSIRLLKRDFTLLLFGIFSVLYGSRLFLYAPVYRSAAHFRPTVQALLALPANLQGHIYGEITFLLPLAGFLFCAQVLDQTLRRRRLFWLLLVPVPIAIAIAGLTCELFLPWAVITMLNVLGLFSAAVVVVVASLLVNDFFRRDEKPNPEMRAFAVGFVIMGVFLVHANLTFFGMPGPNLEPVGFFIFIWVLAYVVVLRSFRNEEQLLAVRNELEIARQIQSSILPQELPKIAGIEIAVRYAPMTTIGGDFYEFLPVDDRRLGILIADVSGHGVPAALTASMVKIAVFSQAENAARPAQLLSGLNRVLCGNLRGQYVTAAYLFLDTENKKLSCACAGHPPALLWNRATGNTCFLENNGLVLGLFPEAEYRGTELAWSPGDRCLLYTDGVIEAENAAEIPFGRDRLEQLMQAEGGNPKAFSEHLLNSIAAWRGRVGSDPQDDITIIAVQFMGGAAKLAAGPQVPGLL